MATNNPQPDPAVRKWLWAALWAVLLVMAALLIFTDSGPV